MRLAHVYLQYPRVLFADILYAKSKRIEVQGKNLRQIIDKDVDRYLTDRLRKLKSSKLFKLNYLLLTNKVFRNQFYYRIESSNKTRDTLSRLISKTILKPLDNVEIGIVNTKFIDGGLHIIHSAGCVISVYTAGENLTVYQGVTIGTNCGKEKDGRKNPIIGSNVTIFSNAVVAGPITIGDNVKIGAGTVVLQDVPSNCTVIGNSPRIIN